jgi:thiol-disulfide isomerase/thioredoxin
MEVKEKYSYLSIRSWMISSYLKSKCKDDDIILLYLYSIPCPDCEREGMILDELREESGGRLKVFVVDGGLDLPIIKTLKKVYSVNTTPFIVAENKTFSGFIGKEGLMRELSIKSFA